MKTTDKAIIELIAIQYDDEFKSIIESIIEDSELDEIAQNLNTLGINEILIPKTFETLVHDNIDIEVSISTDIEDIEEEKLIKLEKTIIGFNKIEMKLAKEFEKELSQDNESYKKVLKDEIKQFKKEIIQNKYSTINNNEDIFKLTDISILRAKYLTIMLEYIWIIIEKWFPIQKFGLPSMNFINSVINIYNEENDKFKVLPQVLHVNDIHSIILKKEIITLREIIKDIIGENYETFIDKKYEEKDFKYKRQLLSEIIEKSKYHFIKVEPLIKKTNLKNAAESITLSIDNINSLFYPELKEMSTQLETLMKYSEKYADIVLNTKRKNLTIKDLYNLFHKKQDVLEDQKYNKYEDERERLNKKRNENANNKDLVKKIDREIRILENEYNKNKKDKVIEFNDFKDQLIKFVNLTDQKQKINSILSKNHQLN